MENPFTMVFLQSDEEFWSEDAWFSDDDYAYSSRHHRQHHYDHRDFLFMLGHEKRKKEKRKKKGKKFREVQELISDSLTMSPVDEEEESTDGNGRTWLGILCPYSSDQKILLVGEGDFSFSACLARSFDYAFNMIASSLNDFGFLVKNYKRAERNIGEITSRGGTVIHKVNATKMANHPKLRSLKFDCIVYNFPFVGFAYRCDRNVSREVEISKHQELVRGFMANAKTMMEPDGEIHITHKCVKFSLDWNLEMLGLMEDLRLVEESPFDFRDYPGYRTKYGFGGDKNFNCVPAKTYKFQLGKVTQERE